MQVNYQLNTTQLNIDFIESIKLLFGDKKIDIVIRDEEDNIFRDDTKYLMSSQKNSDILLRSIKRIEQNSELLIHKSLEDLGIE